MNAVSKSDFIEDLLRLPKQDDRIKYLRRHRHLIDAELAQTLKRRVNQATHTDAERALAIAALIAHMARLSGDPVVEAIGLLAEGNVRCIALSQNLHAVELFDAAAEIFRSYGRNDDVARTQITKIAALTNLGRFEEATAAGELAMQLIHDNPVPELLVGLTCNLGMAYSHAGEHERSLHAYDRALALYQNERPDGQLGKALLRMNRSIELRSLGRLSEAISDGLLAMETFERSGHAAEVARAGQHLATTYFVVGRLNESLVYLDKAHEAFSSDGRAWDAARVSLLSANVLVQLRRFEEAVGLCRNLVGTFDKFETPEYLASCHLIQGEALLAMRQSATATESLNHALKLLLQLGTPSGVAEARLKLAQANAALGRFQESFSMCKDLIIEFARLHLPLGEAQASIQAGLAALELDKQEEAEALIAAALRISLRLGAPDLAFRAHQAMAAAALRAGKSQRALDEVDQSLRQAERLRSSLMLEHRVGFAEATDSGYADAVRLCIELGDVPRALQYVRRAKSRTLVDMLALDLDLRVTARAEEDQPLIDELHALRASRNALYIERRRKAAADPDSVHTIESGGPREISKIEQRITALWHNLLARNAEYASDAALWTVEAEPEHPHAAYDTTVLEYFVMRDETIVFVTDPDGTQAVRLHAPLKELRQLHQRLRLILDTVPHVDPESPPALQRSLRQVLSHLYDLLLRPVSARMPANDALTIVPHNLLHYLPFHALWDGSKYLVEQYELNYLPASSLLHVTGNRQQRTTGTLTLGVSAEGRLPYAVEEAGTIARQTHGLALLDTEANIERVRVELPMHSVLHFASHAEFHDDNPLFSGLRLSDGWLTTLDVFDLKLDAGLVTLSGCDTGRNVIGGGDELLGLVRAFLSSGADSVIVSLWEVEDRSTAALMRRFYAHLGAGKSKGEALRQTQLEFIHDPARHGDPLWDLPYHWAPFVLVGDRGKLR